MIKYEGIENKYLCDMQKVDDIIATIKSWNYIDDDFCTQENVMIIIDKINSMIKSIIPVEQRVTLEREETETEAKEYFGNQFTEKFDGLMTALDKQQTIVALHGTTVDNCKSICENGLQYKTPSLSSTTVLQDMEYGQKVIQYGDYKSLLNWKHHHHKGIIIVAVPYECFYKEGIWNKFQDTDAETYGGQDYRIDPDFIVGYLDIEKKSIIINPKYNRQHNYSQYIPDYECFYKRQNMNNVNFAQLMILEKQKKSPHPKTKETNIDQIWQIKPSDIPYMIEDMLGTFAFVKNSYSNGMSEKNYKHFLEELSQNFESIKNVLPLLKTNEQVLQEQEIKNEQLQASQSNYSSNDSSLWEFDDEINEDDTLEPNSMKNV